MRERIRMKDWPVCLTLLALAALGLACAASVPPAQPRPSFLENPGLHPLYGGQRYLKAVGLSTTSRAEAEIVAKKGVAEQVQSSIQAVNTDRMEEARQSGSETVLAEYKSFITTETGFDRAELIRIDPAASWRKGSTFYAFACLDKDSLVPAFEPEYARAAAAFSALVRNASQALKSGDPIGFLENYRAAAGTYVGLEEKARVLSVGIGGPYAPHTEQERIFISLIEQQLALRSKLRFLVTLRGPDSQFGKDRLKAMFQGFFRQAGYNVVLCESCPCSRPLDYPFLVEANEIFREGVLGPVCVLRLSARVLLCGSEQTVLQMDLTSPKMKGAHTSDRQIAMRKLYAGLPEKEIYRSFEAGMKARFPMEE